MDLRKKNTWASLKSQVMDIPKLLRGFVKNDTWIFYLQSCRMDLLKLLHGFVQMLLCISRTLPKFSLVLFDKDFKAC